MSLTRIEWYRICDECDPIGEAKPAGHGGPHVKRCPSMRGGKRSKVRCEQSVGHAGTNDRLHWGRGRAGQWFTWGLEGL
jgi:hypothetical protein